MTFSTPLNVSALEEVLEFAENPENRAMLDRYGEGRFTNLSFTYCLEGVSRVIFYSGRMLKKDSQIGPKGSPSWVKFKNPFVAKRHFMKLTTWS